VCGINDHGHTCDEYLVLFAKSGMTCCGLSKVWLGGDGKVRQRMWLVLLESAKDWVLGVDPLGQQVPPRVWYGTTCLLIRGAIGSESCSVMWGLVQDVTWIHMVQEGLEVRGNLSTAGGARDHRKP
jgi:hypothetical protein